MPPTYNLLRPSGEAVPPPLQSRPPRSKQLSRFVGRPRLLPMGRSPLQQLNSGSLGGEIRPSLLGLKHLTELDISYNNFQGIAIPTFIGSLNKLTVLGLSDSGFSGLIPYQLGNLSSLQTLDLSSMDNSHHLLSMDSGRWLSNLSSLQSLHLGGVDLSKADGWLESLNSLPSLSMLFLGGAELGDSFPLHLSHVNFTSLRYLGLSALGINSVPSWLLQIPSLEYLNLDNNKLNWTIPETLGQMSQLVELYLSNNNLEGVLSEAQFSNLTELKWLDLSSNSLLDVSRSNWVPPLGLTYIDFSYCKVGPAFPSWIRELRNLSLIHISHTSIADAIPSWFWNFSSKITDVDLSNNEINGTLPSSLRHLINLNTINLGNNLLEGPLPQFPSSLWFLVLSNNSLSGTVNNMLMPHMTYLLVSTNHINGSIPASICSDLKYLERLDFSNNHLSGEIPNCWDSNIAVLEVIDLSNNNLSGGIPTSICSRPTLQSLHLSGNHLSGNLPLTLRNCTEMRILDLGQNMFNGNIPTSIGQTMHQLEVLRLRSNKFFGNIPPQLGHLKLLRFVDLALNNLSGTIPHSFANLSAMKVGTIPDSLGEYYYNDNSINYVDTINVIMKGREDEYTKQLRFLFSIDLAGNSLTGGIPEKLTTLHGLHNLNLSRNHLTGTITEKIADLQSLESLDLSNNNLSGAIPSSMTTMHFLTALNMSFNKFSGKIPSGGQLDALPDPSIYIENQQLCGFPLNICQQYDEPSQPPQQLKTDSKMAEFYLSIGLGFVVSYLSFWGTLLIKNKWRTAYFRFVDDMFDLVYVALAINMAKLKNKWNSL